MFFHVSTNLKHNGVFTPRIPDCRHKDQEDDKTERVSVAPSIEDCLTAIPNGGSHLEELNLENRGYYLIYKIDTEKLGISDEHIVSPDELYERDTVRDASVTNEYWITTPFTVPREDTFLIRLESWDKNPEDVLPYSIYAIAEESYEGNHLEAFQSEYAEFVPCSIRVSNSCFTHEEVEAGEIVTIYYDSEEEKEIILDYLEKKFQAEVLEEGIDEIVFKVKQQANLRPLFMLHADVAMLNM